MRRFTRKKVTISVPMDGGGGFQANSGKAWAGEIGGKKLKEM